MKYTKYLIALTAAIGMTSTAVNGQNIGQETRFDRELRNRDDQAVTAFVGSKENIAVHEKSKNLEISGDVRFEYNRIQEKGIVLFLDEDSYSSSSGSSSSGSPRIHEKYRHFRGGHYVDSRGVPLSNNDFDVEFNLKFKYTYGRSWANAQLQFDNPCGIRGRNDCFGTFVVFNEDGDKVKQTVPRDIRRANKGSGDAFAITLKRAFLGYNIWADGKHRLDIEFGRRKLSDVFDSEVQFTSRFDGMLLKYASTIEDVTDWYWNTAVFVIDERKNHFGWVTEIGLLNIMDSGFDLKYNYIDWVKRGRNRCFIFDPIGMRFQNSEFTLTYNTEAEIYCQTIPIEVYSGFLFNHAAKKNRYTHHKKENLAGYAGILLGEVDKEGDWSLDIEYIYVQAQAVPDFDVGSIGRGNIFDESITDQYNALIYGPSGSDYSSLSDYLVSDSYYSASSSSSSSSSSELVYFPRRGNGNFQGWRFEFLYALTDNLTADITYEFSNELEKKIGGPHHYSCFEAEAIYAF